MYTRRSLHVLARLMVLAALAPNYAQRLHLSPPQHSRPREHDPSIVKNWQAANYNCALRVPESVLLGTVQPRFPVVAAELLRSQEFPGFLERRFLRNSIVDKVLL